MNSVWIGRDFASLAGGSPWLVVGLLLAGTVVLGVKAARTCRRAAEAAPLPESDPVE
jgi:hypothetical protein